MLSRQPDGKLYMNNYPNKSHLSSSEKEPTRLLTAISSIPQFPMPISQNTRMETLKLLSIANKMNSPKPQTSAISNRKRIMVRANPNMGKLKSVGGGSLLNRRTMKENYLVGLHNPPPVEDYKESYYKGMMGNSSHSKSTSLLLGSLNNTSNSETPRKPLAASFVYFPGLLKEPSTDQFRQSSPKPNNNPRKLNISTSTDEENTKILFPQTRLNQMSELRQQDLVGDMVTRKMTALERNYISRNLVSRTSYHHCSRKHLIGPGDRKDDYVCHRSPEATSRAALLSDPALYFQNKFESQPEHMHLGKSKQIEMEKKLHKETESSPWLNSCDYNKEKHVMNQKIIKRHMTQRGLKSTYFGSTVNRTANNTNAALNL